MEEQDWEIVIYKALDAPSQDKSFAVITIVRDRDPSVEFVDSDERAQALKSQKHVLLWRAKQQDV